MARMSVPDYINLPKEEIKRELAILLSKRILSDNLAEFTYIDNSLHSNREYIARCYLAKDGDVKILRTYG